MKIFIFSILVLVGVQFCSAGFSPSCCEADLANFNANTFTFIADFKTLHDSTHDIVVSIADRCVNLFKEEYGLIGDGYPTTADEARSTTQAFIDGAIATATQFFKDFDAINAACDELLQKAGAFMNGNDLTCRFVFGKGCNFELNARRCELGAWMKDLKIKRDNAVAYVNQSVAGLKDIGELVEKFTSSNILTRNDITFCQLMAAINKFIVEFNRLHWIGHIKFVNLQFICDQVTQATSTLYVKYSFC